jgi:GrpB-like predicted nucleotidyltransferase (UPF0157 family)
LENIERISHFGSAAVPELMAEPTVDIPLEIINIDNPGVVAFSVIIIP